MLDKVLFAKDVLQVETPLPSHPDSLPLVLFLLPYSQLELLKIFLLCDHGQDILPDEMNSRTVDHIMRVSVTGQTFLNILFLILDQQLFHLHKFVPVLGGS